MTGIDHCLLDQSRRFITGANVHDVSTWMFCYETSEPHSPGRLRYEQLLREFVASRTLVRAARGRAERARLKI
jgi:hypothetical protein